MNLKALIRYISNDDKRAQDDFRCWGKYLKSHRYEVSTIRCTLAEMIELGEHIPTGYGEIIIREMSPRVLRVQRIWAFMPTLMQNCMYQFYAIDKPRSEQAQNAGLKNVSGLYFYAKKGREFYLENYDIDFSVLDNKDIPKFYHTSMSFA